MSRRTPFRAVMVALAVALPPASTATSPAGAATVPAGFDQRILVEGLSQPVQAAWAPDGRMFVAEKEGRIRVLGADGTLRATPLLDITSRVNSIQDRGLLGIALDPGFASNGRLYYAYTYELNPFSPDSDRPMVARIERVSVGTDNSVSAPTTVLGQDVSGPCPRAADDCLPSNGRSHSIGTIRAAADGTLWIGLGDSASYSAVDDLAFRAQEETSLAGKILHVDASGRGLPGHPFCPGVTDLTKACTKVHAKGFRNPYRFSMRGGTPMVGDVGWGDREEVDRVLPGGNYGWPCHEGERRTTGYSSDPRCVALYDAGGVTAPIWSYAHNNAGAAVAGGPSMPADGGPYGSDYAGALFVGDYATGLVRRLELNPDGTCTATPCGVRPFATGWEGGTDLGLTPRGTLAWTLFGTGGPDGSVVELVPAGANRSPVARASDTPLAGTARRGYRFSSAASSDPDGDPLSSTWDFGDGSGAVGTTVEHTYLAGVRAATVRLTVEDGRGGRASTTLAVTPGDTPPTPVITAPAPNAFYTDGQPVTLRGTAGDPEDGTLTGTALRWRLRLRHNDHIHVLSDPTGSTATFTPYDDHDADSGYEITLVATDSSGNRVESPTVAIRPRTITLTLRSSPPGAAIGYGDQTLTAPASRAAAVGFRTTVTAPTPFAFPGITSPFASWSDGGAAQHNLVIPASDLTLEATYATPTPTDPGIAPDPAPDPGPVQAAGPPPAGADSGGSGPATASRPVSARCARMGRYVLTLAPRGTRRLRFASVRSGSRRLPVRVLGRRRVRVDLRALQGTRPKVRILRLRGRATDRRERTRTVQGVRRILVCPR